MYNFNSLWSIVCFRKVMLIYILVYIQIYNVSLVDSLIRRVTYPHNSRGVAVNAISMLEKYLFCLSVFAYKMIVWQFYVRCGPWPKIIFVVLLLKLGLAQDLVHRFLKEDKSTQTCVCVHFDSITKLINVNYF